jgi:hypothetical protein
MIDLIFSIVQQSLEWVAKKTHRTYNEVNIILYYFLIPLSWAIMIDYIFSLPLIFSISYSLFSIIVAVSCENFTKFCNWLFDKSVDFIDYFGDYYKSSVWLCVAVPFVIYIVLGVFVYKHFKGYY